MRNMLYNNSAPDFKANSVVALQKAHGINSYRLPVPFKRVKASLFYLLMSIF